MAELKITAAKIGLTVACLILSACATGSVAQRPNINEVTLTKKSAAYFNAPWCVGMTYAECFHEEGEYIPKEDKACAGLSSECYGDPQ